MVENKNLKKQLKKIRLETEGWFKKMDKEIYKEEYERCDFCGKRKRVGEPCTCKYGGVFG